MKLILTRKQCREDGIFSDLTREDGSLLAQTLEHAYEGLPDAGDKLTWRAKIVQGSYTCERGDHKLHGMEKPFTTFEVKSVPNAWGILFHWGNFNKDSEGCILVGSHVERAENGTQMITESKKAFERFMNEMSRVNSFELIVT